MRITLIHALKHSIVPIEASFARLWPDVRLMKDGKDESQAEADRNLVADALRNAGFPPPESEEPEPEVKSLSVGIDDYLRFVDIRTDGSLCLHREL